MASDVEWPHGLTDAEVGALIAEFDTDTDPIVVATVDTVRTILAVVDISVPEPGTPWERDTLVESARAKIERGSNG